MQARDALPLKDDLRAPRLFLDRVAFRVEPLVDVCRAHAKARFQTPAITHVVVIFEIQHERAVRKAAMGAEYEGGSVYDGRRMMRRMLVVAGLQLYPDA